MRRRGFFVALAMLAPFAARAQLPASAGPIAALNAGLLKVMHAGREVPFTQRFDTLQPVVQSAFDLKLILGSSVGPRWASIPANLQGELLEAFTRFTVATWVSNFDSFDGEKFEILADVRKIGDDEVVQTRIVPTSGDPTRLDYVMRQTARGWRAIDILLDGSISRVAVQRSDFRGLLKGGDPTPLIAMLRKKVTELADGQKINP
jgi:phospholipid transport system substrate-binding protein